MSISTTMGRTTLDEQLAYWERQLSGELPDWRLPFCRPTRPSASAGGVVEALVLDPGQLREARALSRREGATLYITLLAAFQALLHRYTQQDDSLIAATTARRPGGDSEAEDQGGEHIILLRCDLSGDPCFRELLARVGRVVCDAHQHGDVPLARVARHLGNGKVLSVPSLCRFVYSFPGAPDTSYVNQHMNLRLCLRKTSQGLAAALAFNGNLFDSAGAVRILGHLRTLVNGAVSEPEWPLSLLPLLPEEERRQLVQEWALRHVDYPKDFCIHQLIEAQAERMPGAPAVVFETATLTYNELNRRANQLAHRLIASGVGPEVPVGVCMERSLELPVAVIALLKAGGVLVPLDPDYPRERLHYILDQAAPAVILAQQRFLDRLPPHNATAICVDDANAVANQSSTNLTTKLTADNLCVIFFTSGTTGASKAVMWPHRVICRSLWAQAHAYPVGPSDRCLLMTSISFGAFLAELCSPLIAGATLVVARPGAYKDVEYLLRAIAQHGITVCGPVPSVLRVMLEQVRSEGPESCQSLRNIYSHGEALPPDLQRLLVSHLRADLHKFYGLTETPTATYWNCRSGEDPDRTTIGRPTDMEVYLLDRHLQLVPIGIPGEIYVGGTGMARGYLGRPDLTAERFIPNHLGLKPGSRLHVTGDTARWLPEGVIEFLGRTDEQVKLRGIRIDMHEIEEALARHPDVDQAIVALQEPRSEEKRLAAWVLGKMGRTPGAEELRRFLRDRLPEHLIPAVFFPIKALPRTPNGKVDRRAVAALIPDGQDTGRKLCAPSTEMEKTIADIWANVLELGSSEIDVTDDFHELGGDSLLIIGMLAQIEKRLGQAVSVTSFLEAPTIRQLARLVAGNAISPAARESLTPSGHMAPNLFCLNYGYVLGKYLAKDCSVYAIELRGEDRLAHTHIDSLTSALIAKVRAIQPQGPYVLFGFNQDAIVALAMARQLSKQGQEVGLLALAELPLFVSRNGGLLYHSYQTLMHWISRLGAHGSWFLHHSPKHWPDYLQGRLRAAGHIVEHDMLGRDSAADKALKFPNAIALDRSIARFALEPHHGQVVMFVNKTFAAKTSWLHRKWKKLGLAELEIIGLPDQHHLLMQEPCISLLTQHLRDRIREVCQSSARINRVTAMPETHPASSG